MMILGSQFSVTEALQPFKDMGLFCTHKGGRRGHGLRDKLQSAPQAGVTWSARGGGAIESELVSEDFT